MAITIPNPFGGGAVNKTATVKRPTTSYTPPYPSLLPGSRSGTGNTSAASRLIQRYQSNPPPTVKTTSGGTSYSSGGGSSSGGGGGTVRTATSSGGGSSSGGGGGGGGGGGSSSGGGNTSAGINQKFTGWAAGPYGDGIKPDMAVQLMENPDAFLRQVMFINGMNPDTHLGSAGSASPYIQDMNQLALIMMGNNPNFGAGDLNSTLNWMGNFIDQGMTPGGSGINFGTGLNNLTRAQGSGASSTPLYSHLTNNLTSQGQASEFLGLASALANASLHPLWARAFQDEVRRQGDAYVSKSAANEMDNFPEWVARRMGL